jgi:hypothetical protein
MFRTGRTVQAFAILTALCGVSAAGLAASPDGDRDRGRWGHNDRDHDWNRSRAGIVIRVEPRPVIISRPRPTQVIVAGPQVVIARPVVIPDVLPADLQYAAYQSQDRVIIVISGTNRAAGYSTSLTAIGGSEWTPTLVLRNTAATGYCAEVCTPFSLSAAICSPRALTCVRLQVAGHIYEIPVTAVPSIS